MTHITFWSLENIQSLFRFFWIIIIVSGGLLLIRHLFLLRIQKKIQQLNLALWTKQGLKKALLFLIVIAMAIFFLNLSVKKKFYAIDIDPHAQLLTLHYYPDRSISLPFDHIKQLTFKERHRVIELRKRYYILILTPEHQKRKSHSTPLKKLPNGVRLNTPLDPLGIQRMFLPRP